MTDAMTTQARLEAELERVAAERDDAREIARDLCAERDRLRANVNVLEQAVADHRREFARMVASMQIIAGHRCTWSKRDRKPRCRELHPEHLGEWCPACIATATLPASSAPCCPGATYGVKGTHSEGCRALSEEEGTPAPFHGCTIRDEKGRHIHWGACMKLSPSPATPRGDSHG